jgi:methyltransferase (TIGR00027 family)
MDMSPVGSTAQWIAAARALETESEAPLFTDPYARALAGEAGFATLAVTRAAAGGGAMPPDMPDPYLSLRTRFLDDTLIAAVADANVRQVVLLAAGMDTRAFRLGWPADTVLFELDRDDIFGAKEPVLAAAGATPRCDRRIVEADLAGDWVPLLTAAGFDASRPAAFLIEGLLMYLEPSAALRLFATVDALAAPGSVLGLDVVNSDMLTSAYTVAYMAKLRELGCPWRYGCDDPARTLASYGWDATVVAPGEPDANYGRWRLPVVPRSIANLPRTFFVRASRLTAAERERRMLSTAQVLRSATCLVVPDVGRAVEYYRDVLGFAIELTPADEVQFAIVVRGAATVMLRLVDDGARIVPNEAQGGTWDLFLWVDDVEALHKELQVRGATIVQAPIVRPYRIKEMVVRDLNGYVLAFGQDVAAS